MKQDQFAGKRTGPVSEGMGISSWFVLLPVGLDRRELPNRGDIPATGIRGANVARDRHEQVAQPKAHSVDTGRTMITEQRKLSELLIESFVAAWSRKAFDFETLKVHFVMLQFALVDVHAARWARTTVEVFEFVKQR
jgi:hypothetical protein